MIELNTSLKTKIVDDYITSHNLKRNIDYTIKFDSYYTRVFYNFMDKDHEIILKLLFM